jgi:hypothetical protein
VAHKNACAPHSFNDVEEAQKFYNNLYSADNFRKCSSLVGAAAGAEKTKKGAGAEASKPSGSNGRQQCKRQASKDGPMCIHCGKNHESDPCWTLAKNKDNRPGWFKSGGYVKRARFDKAAKTERNFSTKELNAIVSHAVCGVHKATKARYSKRQRILVESDEEDDELNAAMPAAGIASDNDSETEEYVYPLS